ncbi:type IV toxin-antitoxin system AbiEi family antitoxin [Chryseobacterium sp. M5]|uniref:type IV toxin-antitoxin system AbiEi family antitoxin n=1 Tax=Chryseobacterium sp. M5 TaxID=3379128 RepID=UPI0038576577
MYRDNDFIYEAIANFEEYSGLKVNVESTRNEYDAVLQIQHYSFCVWAKASARKSNVGIILEQIQQYDKNKNWILIADYLAKDVAEILRQQNCNYIDGAGNANIRTNNLFIHIEGKKKEKKEKKNQSRAFQEVGLKLLLLLISDEQSLQLSFRALAEKTDISLGSVSYIFQELEDSGFILKTKQRRILKNLDVLIERWVIAYNEVLKPRLLRKKYSTKRDDIEFFYEFSNAEEIYWGGEPAAKILTASLRPAIYTIYYNGELPKMSIGLKLIPDSNGNIEVYNMFWTDDLKFKYPNTAPPLVVYADLMGTESSRNAEAAKIIMDNELQY